MTLLIANIGTSDLAVKIDNYYVPIGFDRNEPNIEEAEAQLNTEEETAWKNRSLISSKLAKLLGLTVERPTFRQLTQSLLSAYQKDPETWHERLRPARIFSVVQTAHERFKVNQIYIFVTNQPEIVQSKPNPGYGTDSIHLYEILKLWFERHFSHRLALQFVVIPPEISAIDIDGLFNEYYKFFLQREPQELTLISVKGGTPQMQTALRVQAISSNLTQQIYLEPRLSIAELLAGQPSACQTISYWRYQRLQKYQSVKQLLKQWDFDGARTLLQEWQVTLQNIAKDLESSNAPDLPASQETISACVKALNMAIGYLNFDSTFAKSEYKSDSERLKAFKPIVDNYPLKPGEKNKHYPKLLNLYTQCCLFWHSDRIADFLTRIGLFYEETLHELIYALGGDLYFDRPRPRGDWVLNTNDLLNKNFALAQKFYQIEKVMGKEKGKELALVSQLNKGNCIIGDRWKKPLSKQFKLPGRITKRNFAIALLETSPSLSRKQCDTTAKSLLYGFKSLDYWCLKRNKLVHGARGISKQRMKEVLQEDREFYAKEQPKGTWIDYDIKNSVGDASEHDKLLDVMTEISRLTLELIGTPEQRSLLRENPGYFEPQNEVYYIYSEIGNWVVQNLEIDILTALKVR
ncbi:hypothetical protein [Oscillatoria sp. FACHB-1406]|uniref:hypothetical protein n=1 Tax=Oscillatoria sp. FACHB-1406 TaxID=2692846 RepID=UPI001687B1BA|nr:hypothetical protein [Oscillatoria sp. FACHB-1406]MBD2580124.1 hypothetical protein [Oscillatoria sp. FACHB-1406]